jgi:hypothetical protein
VQDYSGFIKKNAKMGSTTESEGHPFNIEPVFPISYSIVNTSEKKKQTGTEIWCPCLVDWYTHNSFHQIFASGLRSDTEIRLMMRLLLVVAIHEALSK